MRPDELRAKMDAVESLRDAVTRLEKAETICAGHLYFNGYQGTNFTEDETEIVRRALVDHCQEDVTIKAGLLRVCGVDPSSLMPKKFAL